MRGAEGETKTKKKKTKRGTRSCQVAWWCGDRGHDGGEH